MAGKPIDGARGLPIAAHLGLLVALAFASAFVVIVAVLVLLPPRPPDVTRGDLVVERFTDGFREAIAEGRTPIDDRVRWAIVRTAPGFETTRGLGALREDVATRLAIEGGQVKVAANAVRSDTFVFRVRDMERRIAEHHDELEALEERIDAGEGPVIVMGTTVTTDGEGGARRVTEIRPDEVREAVGEWRARRREGGLPKTPPVPPNAPVPPSPPLFAPAPAGVVLLSGYQIAAQLPDGRWLTMRQGRDWEQLSWIGRAAGVIGGTLAMLSLLALFFARRLARPIQSFAHAVEAVGVNPQSAPVDEKGPQELRGAARAINTMQARLRALIADRTKTLAAVAHDMRTPLMRLRLVAENVEPAQRDRMAKEIEEVEALVASFIAFARDDPAEEARVRLDLSALLQSLTDDHAEAGRDVTFNGEERLVITGQSLGLKRVFGNLIDNALKYASSARINLTRGDGMVIVDIADDGPGVPLAQRETVFEPFVRLNGEGTRGAGLGLAAARSIARTHGGDVEFVDTEKGAIVRVTLPG